MRVVTHYLEMRTAPAGPLPDPPPEASVHRVEAPSVDWYRQLYDAVGSQWHWIDRKRMSDAELAAILGDPAVEVYLLTCDGQPAGYAELDRRVAGEVELAYFGLLPAFIGRGLGSYLLGYAIARAFASGPRRLWVHTCSLDHPSALRVYQQAGFVEYDRTEEQVPG